ncbi:CDT1-like protein a, chloroplastic, partial [Mucuna pruriens]
MEQKACEESSKIALGLKCEKVLEAVDESIACPTPQKNAEPLTIKSREGKTQIPQEYWALAELFGHMSCSLRLLLLFKKTPIFQNICRQVEVLSKRKFSYTHLAQMKYIIPESVCIDKVLVHDKKSLCMMADMKITLRYEVVQDSSGVSADLALRRYFNSRLINFFDTHPEVADIPEAPLPDPFNKKIYSFNREDSDVEKFTCQSSHVNNSTALLSITNQIEILPEKFQVYPSFRRHFSRKNVAVAEQVEKAQCFSSTKTSLPSHASDCLDNEENKKALQKGCAPLSDHVANLNMERGHQKESFSQSFQPSIINTPVHMIRPPHSVTYNSFESPDMKNVSCAADSFVTETPARSAPARLLPISDVKLQNTPIHKSTSCHKLAKRVLDFSLMEDNDGLDIRVDKLESSRALHEIDSFPESSRGCSEDCNSFGSVSVPQEAEESLGYSFEKITQNQAGLDTRHKKSSPLLNLVNVITSIFQSVNRNPITKEELLQKILMNSLDFVNIVVLLHGILLILTNIAIPIGEVEEQVESLEKLVPDWICKKSVLIGDMYWWVSFCLLLIRSLAIIKKVSDLDSVRSRLSSNESLSNQLLRLRKPHMWPSVSTY